MTTTSGPRTARLLLHTCHPLPTAAVTGTATTLAIAAGNSAATCVLVLAAVLTGQLSVGWSNDRIDVHRDRRVGHPGKPVAEGLIGLRTMDVAIAIALVLTVALSVPLGWRAAVAQWTLVASAWAFNLYLHRTVVSWVPYAIGFGAVPFIATWALPAHPAPLPWIVLVAALIGTAVNFLNPVPTLGRHPESDVHSLADRWGGRPSLLVGAGIELVATAVIAAHPGHGPRWVTVVGTAVSLLLIAVGVRAFWSRADSRAPFYGLIALAPVQLLTVVVTAHPLY